MRINNNRIEENKRSLHVELTNVLKFYYIVQQHQKTVHSLIYLYLTISMRTPMLIENIVNIQEYYLIVDVVEQLIEMLANKNR